MYKKIIVLCGSLFILSNVIGCGKENNPQQCINLGNYNEVNLESLTASEVTEEEIDQYIDEIRLRNAEEIEITNGSAEKGDLVYIDFKVKEEGLEEFSEEDCMLTIGMGEIAEGLDQSVIGHLPGDIYEFIGTMSNDFYNVDSYYNEKLAGEKVVFEIKLKSISRLELPKLDDEFVKNVSEKSKTVEEYREEIRNFLGEDDIKEMDVKDAIWKVVTETTDVKKYPEEELEVYHKRQKDHYKKMAEDYDMTYEEFVKSEIGSSQKEFKKRVKEEAKERLKEQLIAKEIAKRENIVVQDQDEKFLEEVAQENDYADIRMLKECMSGEELKDALLLQAVKNWLAENSKINS